MILRPAQASDADGMSAVLEALVTARKRTKPSDAGFVLAHYIQHPNRIECYVAVSDEGDILGFQSLKIAVEGNAYGAPVGWGVIGTHVHPQAVRRGVGTALFQKTLQAARLSGVPAIDALIGAQSAEGLAYYDAMGFRDYRFEQGAVGKSIAVQPGPGL